MKLLFIWANPGYVAKYGSTVELLAKRGHRIHLGFDKDRDDDSVHAQLAGMCERYPGITYGPMPPADKQDAWFAVATGLRTTIDYLRYLQPRYRNAFSLRGRMEERAPVWQQKLGRVLSFGGPPAVSTAIGLLKQVERAVPSRGVIEAYLREQHPDLVLVSPLVEPGSRQVDYLKSAQALGIHTGLAVHSWDNLTNKGLMRICPERVFVWNETQRDEAVTLHGVPARRVVITGAQAFDGWFGRQPSTSREQFCQKVGLDPTRPFLLYLGSSYFIAPDESGFCQRWIGAIRTASDPVLAGAGVLIRPHPKNNAQFAGFPSDEMANVAIWPPVGGHGIDAEAQADFFDSMYHAAGCMGVNTSAQIEAGIVGRPVFTLRSSEFSHSHDGTLHFHYLMNVNGGLLHAATTMDEHLQQLAEAVRGGGDNDEKSRRFVEAFVRPFGLDVAATPVLAGAIEELGQQPAPRRARLPLWAYPIRGVLNLVVRRVERRLRTAPGKKKGSGGRTHRVYGPNKPAKREIAMRSAPEAGNDALPDGKPAKKRTVRTSEPESAVLNGVGHARGEVAAPARKVKKARVPKADVASSNGNGHLPNGVSAAHGNARAEKEPKLPRTPVNPAGVEDA